MAAAIPVVPRVLEDLKLAKQACSKLGAAGEVIELWEAYALAQADGAALQRDLERMSALRGTGTAGAALLGRLANVRRDTGPLVEYLRQALPGSLPLLADAAALDLALVFIMSTPPARDAVVRWFKNPAASRDEAMRLLRTMGRMVESYQEALKDAAPPPPPPKPVAPDEMERKLQERLEASKRSITERRTREKDEAAKAARAKAEAEEAERKAREEAEMTDGERAARARMEQAEKALAEARRIREEAEAAVQVRAQAEVERVERESKERETRIRAREQAEADAATREKAAREEAEAQRARIKAEAEENARQQAEAERVAREKAEAERATRLKAEAERVAEAQRKADAERVVREKAEAERIVKEKAEAERQAREKAEAERIAREKAEAERVAREKAEAERQAREKAEAERIAREKAEAERIAREKAEAERVTRERAEAERQAREKAEAERIAREKAEAERIAREKAEAERIAREKAEAERLAKEKAEAERIAREKAEKERIAREKAEAERIAKEKAEAERLAKEKAEAERIAREKAEAERVAREKAGTERKAREAADGRLTPEQRAARDQARVELRARLPGLLADPWRDQKVGSWFRIKSVTGRDESYSDLGLRERGAGYTVLGVQVCVGGRSEWEKWERTESRSTQLVGQEMIDVGGTLVDCDVYQLSSRAGQEKVWILLDGPHAGAPVKWESSAVTFVARKIEPETLAVGTKSFDCAKMTGEETAGGKKVDAVRWWASGFPLGPVKSTNPTTQTEAVKAGENWANRPPFPS